MLSVSKHSEIFFRNLLKIQRRKSLQFNPWNASSQETMEQTESHKPRVSRRDLFLTFSRISLSSFGGAIFWARRQLIDRQRWLTEREFVDVLTLGQLLPGPNVLNLTVMVGYRFAGWTGAAAAVAGFLGWPCLVVIGMGVLYQQYGALPQVQQALAGMSIVAAGLLLARSEEHTSELQSPDHLVCRLLLEKKKHTITIPIDFRALTVAPGEATEHVHLLRSVCQHALIAAVGRAVAEVAGRGLPAEAVFLFS